MPKPRRDLDPLVMFRLMCETGSRFQTARLVNYAPRSLAAMASRDNRRGEPALQFALDAGKYIYAANRARRLAGLEELSA